MSTQTKEQKIDKERVSLCIQSICAMAERQEFDHLTLVAAMTAMIEVYAEDGVVIEMTKKGRRRVH